MVISWITVLPLLFTDDAVEVSSWSIVKVESLTDVVIAFPPAIAAAKFPDVAFTLPLSPSSLTPVISPAPVLPVETAVILP